jgi:alkylhydroperoxidase family enzyme
MGVPVYDPRMRTDLVEAHDRAWAAIAGPGTWLSGERRVAVAAEVRKARDGASCDALGKLSEAEVELIHRVVGDPGRLSETWVQSVLARGLSEGEYVEIVGIIAMVMMMDAFAQGMGLAERALPAPMRGEPTRYRPAGAKKKAAWLPLVEPEDATEADGPMYPSPKAGYIYRALSLVPQSLRDYWALANCHYIPGPYVYQFDKSIRAITRPQTEIMAARVSAMHQCVY